MEKKNKKKEKTVKEAPDLVDKDVYGMVPYSKRNIGEKNRENSVIYCRERILEKCCHGCK